MVTRNYWIKSSIFKCQFHTILFRSYKMEKYWVWRNIFLSVSQFLFVKRFSHHKHSPRFNVMLNLPFKLNDLDIMLATGKFSMKKTVRSIVGGRGSGNSCTLHQTLHNMKHKKTWHDIEAHSVVLGRGRIYFNAGFLRQRGGLMLTQMFLE